MLILMAGLPGTGKTYVAKKLAPLLNAVILSKDTVRHALFPPELIEYSTEQDDFVVEVLLQTAEYIWKRNRNQILIIDGRTFSQASQRRHVIDFAEKQMQEWRIIECVCDQEMARQRLTIPDPTHPAGNRNAALYNQVKDRWQPLEESKIVVSTDSDPDVETLAQNIHDFARRPS
jgi:predicted kinase